MMNKNYQILDHSIVTKLSGKITSIKPTLHGTQIILDKVKIPSKYERNYGYINKIKINISKKFINNNNDALEIGDHIFLKVQIMPPQGSVLPGTFDFGFYMYIDGLQARGYALTPHVITKKSKKNHFVDLIDKIRFQIYTIFTKTMDINIHNILAAILLGYTKSIPIPVLNDIRNSGIAHILCVSGLHLSLVAMICFVTSRILLNCSNFIAYNANIKTIAGIISIFGSFLYLLLSGTNIAAIRAFIMTSVIIIALMIGKSPHPMRSLTLAAFFVLITSPGYIFHPSFQLSFIAVLCLISGYNLYQKYQYILGKRGGIFSSIKFYIFTNLYATCIASFATTPFVIYHFYKVPTYTLIMNLIAVPLMSFCIMPLGIIALISIPFNLHHQILNLLSFCINIIIKSSSYITSLPESTINTGHITSSSLMIFTVGFLWLCIWHTKIKYFGVILMIISIIAMMSTPKPDLIYDFEQNLIGLKNQNGKLEIYQNSYTKQTQKFLIDYWISWYGQKEIIQKRISMHQHDLLFNTSNNKLIAINHHQCSANNLRSDVEIITSKKLTCFQQNSLNISHDFLVKNKVILIYCSDIWSKWFKKQCRVVTYH